MVMHGLLLGWEKLVTVGLVTGFASEVGVVVHLPNACSGRCFGVEK